MIALPKAISQGSNAAGGGAFKSAREVIAVASVLVPKELASPTVEMFDA